ncbi:cellulose binding domain-containing protein [Streptomyces sp. Amel2xB2]|uniref:cellulose binding domain-containing protein n=1 Tax=Streptomyces sp. Amel2xB2 TaxID=1305829 RepID=UPI000DB98805|nr:cellulose binding domain-containing protein [Streptomyces sp. Amel2xB2]RAJ71314.1 cellulose binding domain-containing protein [Streptomyces sp. Amel2xB2]
MSTEDPEHPAVPADSGNSADAGTEAETGPETKAGTETSPSAPEVDTAPSTPEAETARTASGTEPSPPAPEEETAAPASDGETPLVRPYADLPAHMVQAPAVLPGSVREVLDAPATGTDGAGADGRAGSRFSPLRRGTARVVERIRRHSGLAAPVGGALAVLLLTGVVLQQTGGWPFARDESAAPVPDARLPLPPPVGGTDGSPSGRATDDGKKPKPSASHPKKDKDKDDGKDGEHTAEPPPSPAPSGPGAPPPGDAGGAGQPGNTGCAASWHVDSQWEDFSATVTVTNETGRPVRGWEVGWTWNSGQKLVKHWNSEIQESGTSVTARNVGTNAEIPSTGEATFGFEATGSGTPAPRLTCRLL